MKRQWAHRFGAWMRQVWPLLPAALYLLGFLFVVLTYLFGMSLSLPDVAGVSRFSLEPVRHVFAMEEFRSALWNTVVFVLIGTPLELVVGLILALLLYRTFVARSFVRGVFSIPLAIPALVTATLLFILFDFPGGHINDLLMGKYSFFPAVLDAPINWRGTKFFSLGISLLGKVWRDMTISMLILLAGLNSLDPELLDAARIMGANRTQRLRYIVLPLIMPSISAVILLRSIEMWKEFIFPFVLAGRYNLLGTLIESLYNSWGYSHEAAVVALVLVLCVVTGALFFMMAMELGKRTVLSMRWKDVRP